VKPSIIHEAVAVFGSNGRAAIVNRFQDAELSPEAPGAAISTPWSWAGRVGRSGIWRTIREALPESRTGSRSR